jgi:small conductance mechanosensitive channel
MRIDLSNAWRQIQGLLNDAVTLLPNLILGIVIFGLFFIAGRYVARLVRTLTRGRGHNHGVGLLLGRLAHYLVLIVGLLVALSTVFPSFKARDLIQVLGIGGVAIGFAFKDIFQNFLAGIIILISRPFRIGDKIIVKSYEGTVEDIQTRATTIRTYDNHLIVIPNTVLFTEEVTVLTAYDKRRAEYEIGIGTSADLEKARGTILNALQELPEILDEPKPDVLLSGFGESSTNLLLRWWTLSEMSASLVKDIVLTRVSAELEAAQIDLPFPTRTVLFYDETSRSELRNSQTQTQTRDGESRAS